MSLALHCSKSIPGGYYARARALLSVQNGNESWAGGGGDVDSSGSLARSPVPVNAGLSFKRWSALLANLQAR